MKSNNNFREQVTLVTGWFKTWSECEQTVALYSLLKKLTPSQAKFLVQVLQQSLAECTEARLQEEKANDPAFISKACSESKDKAILHLLKYLPLLQSGNSAAKKEYLRIIPEVLKHSIENGVNIEESRQLLSYSLIHPAISGEERLNFRLWLGYLEERFTYSISPTRAPTQSPSSADHTPGSFTQETGIQLSHTNGQWNNVSSTQDVTSIVNGSDNGENTGINNFLGNNFGSHQSLRNFNSQTGVLSPSSNGHLPLQATSSAPPKIDTQTPITQQGNSNQHNKMHQPLCRTFSITPPAGNPNPQKTVTDWLRTNDNHLSRGNSSSTCEHAPLSPQSSVTSSGSGSDTHPDDGGPQPIRDSFMEEGSGMREVPVWLKNLRLHKYAALFRQMTYEDMMNLSEDWLEAQNVTKGARHKIILSIVKLRERQERLRRLEKEIMERGSIKDALQEMRTMLNTPIKAYTPATNVATSTSSPHFIQPTPHGDSDANKIADGDLTGQFTRLMGKICTQLLVASRPDDECFSTHLHLIDKCLSHEAFTQKQKNLLAIWKQQAHKIWQPPPYKYGTDKPRKVWGNTFPLAPMASRLGGKPIRPPPKQQWSFGSKRLLVGSVSSGHMPLQKNNSLNAPFLNKPGLLEGKQQVTRTNSAPIRSGQLSLSVQPANDEGNADTEINARLDSLCISMTEHALGS